MRTIPDNNVLIYGLVGASKNQKEEQEASEKYIDCICEGEEKSVLINLIENEFWSIFHSNMADAMNFVRQAEKSSWEDAAEDNTLDSNFIKSLKKNLDDENKVRSFNEWRQKVLDRFELLKNSPSLKYPHLQEFNPSDGEEDCLLNNIFRKKNEGDEDLRNDVRIIYKLFKFSNNSQSDIIVVSCDKNMYNSNFSRLEDCIDLSNYSNFINSKQPQNYI